MGQHSKLNSTKMRDLWWRHEELDRLAAQAASNNKTLCAARLRTARDEVGQRMLHETPREPADVAALVLATLPKTVLDPELGALRLRAEEILIECNELNGRRE